MKRIVILSILLLVVALPALAGGSRDAAPAAAVHQAPAASLVEVVSQWVRSLLGSSAPKPTPLCGAGIDPTGGCTPGAPPHG